MNHSGLLKTILVYRIPHNNIQVLFTSLSRCQEKTHPSALQLLTFFQIAFFVGCYGVNAHENNHAFFDVLSDVFCFSIDHYFISLEFFDLLEQHPQHAPPQLPLKVLLGFCSSVST
ncbi:hypothetical protein BpHYR1_049730 [Brachionus plicatilis]|uniref:Uncharacterized protein n=1 Tax=Brachionus plicatilis TaxID=10195 RepID=A0A3M7SAM8_BRAPC|nr:hypothetical protein BpHYR1_049730 [Brachionus plicatilis]